MQTTILKPIGKNRANKTYALSDTGKPELVSSYDHPKHFDWAVAKFKDLQGFYKILDRCKDKNVFRISGLPRKGLKQRARRLKENFVTDETRLIYFDADGWKLPEGYTIRTKDDIYKSIKHVLCDHIGLEFLRDCACIVLLSASTWSYKQLRAHIYFILDEEIDIEELHEWGKAYNKLDNEYKLDYSVFRRVQPDFVSKRVCEGFKDPLPDGLRLTIHCDNLSQYVSTVALKEHISDDLLMADAVDNSTTHVVDNQMEEKGATWEETLGMCGTAQHGINDPAYRGCAQLVQAIGNRTVKANLNYYVEKVFDLVWSAIRKHQVRDNKKEREYYDKARFRNYLQTALTKQFGKSADVNTSDISKAVKQVIAGGNPALLFDNDLLDKYRILRAKSPGQWATFRTVVKNKLKGKVNISDIDKAIAVSSSANMAEQIESIVNSFQWVEGSLDNGLYCKKVRPTGYSLIGLDSGVDSDVYVKALETFDGEVPHNFEKNVMKYLAAKSRDDSTSLFGKAMVEARCLTVLEDGKNVLYFNLGNDDLNNMTTCVVKEDSINVIPSAQSPVVWSTDKNIHPCKIASGYDNVDFRKTNKKYVVKFIKNIRKFVTADDNESMTDAIAWVTSAVLNIGTAPILEIAGASGDGKSTSALFLKELIDPTSADIKQAPDLHNGIYKKEDLSKVLRARHVTIFDNLSNLKPYTQDLLCSIATGWRYDLRLMYTQQFLPLNIKKPIILTSLAPIITNQDLRSRSVSISVARRMKNQGVDIYELWRDLEEETRLGFFMFVSRVLKRINGMRDEGKDLNARDLWLNAARIEVLMAVNYKGGQASAIQRVINSRKRTRDMSEALLSHPSDVIIAWVANDVDTFQNGRVETTAGKLHRAFEEWVHDHAGDVVKVSGNEVQVRLDKIPTNPRSMGVWLSKLANDIETITGWRHYKKRTSISRLIGFAFEGDLT